MLTDILTSTGSLSLVLHCKKLNFGAISIAFSKINFCQHEMQYYTGNHCGSVKLISF